jgi:hypothetical protein
MKNHLSSFVLLLFILLLTIIQIALAAPVKHAEAGDHDIVTQDWLDAAYEQYYSLDSPASYSPV